MKWKAIILPIFALLVFSACTAPVPVPPAEVEEAVEQVESASVEDEETIQQADETEMGATSLPVVTVYKSPTCGCCSAWVEHMEESGFVVEANDVSDLTTVKAENHVPGQLQACHTAVVDGYVIEGHVPAEDISRLLAEQPDVVGIAVPGMPVGSPGMGAGGRTAQPFDVISFDEDGAMEIFASHGD